jgi:hypothetical protein
MSDYERALERIVTVGATWAHLKVAAEAAEAALARPTLSDHGVLTDQGVSAEQRHISSRARAAEIAAFTDWLGAYAHARAVAGDKDAIAWAAYDRVWSGAEGEHRALLWSEIERGSLAPGTLARALAAADAFALARESLTHRFAAA